MTEDRVNESIYNFQTALRITTRPHLGVTAKRYSYHDCHAARRAVLLHRESKVRVVDIAIGDCQYNLNKCMTLPLYLHDQQGLPLHLLGCILVCRAVHKHRSLKEAV